jgi:CRP-like cAMP-binding protein
MPQSIRPAAVNRLLSSLPGPEYKRLSSDLKLIRLEFGEVLYEPGDTMNHVYFPNDSIVSLLQAMSGRSTLEVGMVGNEGVVGLSVFLGVSVASTRAIVQGAGSGMRMSSAVMRQEANRLGSFHKLLHRYTHSWQNQVSQSSACHGFHPVEARLARWLMMSSDRLGSNEFPMTQEFMSSMLGVRREGVNKAAGTLQSAGLISYSRGMIAILNRPRLKKLACECYGIIKAESEQYLN